MQILLALLAPQQASAQAFEKAFETFVEVEQTAQPGQRDDLVLEIGFYINAILGVIGVIGLILIIWAGFMWMTSRGQSDVVDRSKRILIYTTIGLVVLLLAWSITTYLFTQLSQVQLTPSP